MFSQQEHAIPIVYSKDRLSHIQKLLKECNFLNVYQVIIWKNLVFKHQMKKSIQERTK